ncbi:hypothetical protein BAG01nite_37280 [Brevibacillus agri]|uniref:Uncharacterized protein n=1 Tax=Brevibacillus agri TaxID=51101 RepID=A0A3M8ANE9_9BACL|nr:MULTISPECIES: hypothetical protein [Brevibacillus]ELK43972.1 hypothetical protein D478_00735 [Brevibacillus agri BAB-2500]EJL39165.1 hypothetical protein PMI08_05137 [Brevibacillus sp. CF112]MBG9564068.1 hypothetical protein [Brevibacillus agri]MBY0054959.1 hypothetical protein [Brevibacillus agri]MCG5253603.1 hypothetical protein [Brevibacillus agri]
MSGDFVADLLGKLSKRTGREWTLNDIMKLAQKFPKGGGNVDELMNELSEMGLDVPEETKERVKERMKSGKSLSMEELVSKVPKEVKAKSSKPKKPSKAAGKSKHLSLAERVKKLSGGSKKKR